MQIHVVNFDKLHHVTIRLRESVGSLRQLNSTSLPGQITECLTMPHPFLGSIIE